MKVITNPITNIPKTEKSHVLGWTQIWQNQLNAAIDHKCSVNILKADQVYVDHGVNFGGTLNLFGGATKEIFDKINTLLACNNITSLDCDMPDYGAMLKVRIGNNTTYEGITEKWCDMVSERIKYIPFLTQKNIISDGITYGDSHTIAFSATGDRVYRTDGKTLYGSLRRGLREDFKESVHRLTICLGSIDIRHHILRYPSFDLKETLKEYVRQGNELGDDVWFTAPVPVEYEGRKLPKTGYFKKTPFFGSWKERYDLTNRFIEILHDESKGKVVMPPEHWYTMDPEKYANTYMEHGGSVHIAPPFHRRNDWGVSPLGV